MSVSYNASAPIVSSSKSHCQSSTWSSHHNQVQAPLQAVSDARLNSSYPHVVPSAAGVRWTDQHVENIPLISRPSSSRTYSRLSKSPAQPSLHNPPTASALFPNSITQPHQRRQNVHDFFVNVLPSRDQPGPSNNNGTHRSTNLGSAPLSSFAPFHNGSINTPSHRHLPTLPVFHTTSDLAAHHGIPQFLPPVPRTTRHQSVSSTNSHSDSVPSSGPAETDLDFSTLCSNYLTMLSQKPEDRDTNVVDSVASRDASDNGVAVQALMEVLQASPEFQMANDFNDYLTSPLDDSPWDEFLTTPAIGSADMDILTSPAIVDADDFNDFGGAPLFANGGLGLTGAAADGIKAPATAPSATTLPTPSFPFDAMYTMPSPNTPALDPASLHSSPRLPTIPPPSTPVPRRKTHPTGTRKNITPESLVPLDAPIQPRKYVTPSATSRKDVPAVFAKKRARSQAFGDEDDPLVIGADGLAPTDVDAIEAKRRQNTLAARRSRKRKLEYQRELELGMEQEKAEKEMWKSRALMYEALLRNYGHEVPALNP
ncbi:hypothetical protein AcW1_007636 [Taiwanofungus camphoratus]|nr:hypothetical protein AcV5_007648 [Antrodia cinnamomea]KAI0953410.1 hypothetical protein AcW1_007636 [Antrodia cinnamomea]